MNLRNLTILFVFVIPTIKNSWAQNQAISDLSVGNKSFRRIVIDSIPPQDPWIKIVGDINGDGKPDIVVGGVNGPLIWYENPTWVKHDIAEGGYSTVQGTVGDIDGDGDLDVALGGVFWYENLGSSVNDTKSLWRIHKIDDSRQHDIELADLDGDGKLDVAARDQSEFGFNDGNKVSLYKQENPDKWTKVTIPCPHGGGLLLADIDHDGDKDIVIGGRWYENPGQIAGADWKEHIISKKWDYSDTKIIAADFNGDGRFDVAICPSELKGNSYKIAWYEAPVNPKSEGYWTEHIVDNPVESIVHAFNAADMDGDGFPDIVAASMHQGAPPQEVRVYFNKQAGQKWKKMVISNKGSHETWAVDMDSDGAIDIVGANWSGSYQPLEWWRNTMTMPKTSNKKHK